ncbi:MAG: prealbumin-like fold domain-containing protein [Thermoproteota archaeon]|nr:prealbumin-like fold domain-containing protein [Thermoproteota archaeon]
MSGRKVAVIVSVVTAAVAAVTTSAVFLVLQNENLFTIFATKSDNNNNTDSSSNAGKLTIIFASDSSLTNQSGYVISPDPFGNLANYTIRDGSGADENKAPGIVEISGLPLGTYVVRQIEGSSPYDIDKVPKTVEITNQSSDGIAMFSNVDSQAGGQQQKQNLQNRTSPIRNLTYYVKFECGTISGDEGPLRPGHYDTDIGILNKQDFAANIQWSITANNSRNTNSIIRVLEPQASTNIVCKDLQSIIGNEQRFVEGFVIINLPLDPGLLASLSDGTQVLGRNLEETNNLLEVQAFYTANALDALPHEVLADKITFALVNDTSGKIPLEMINKTLDITVSSNLNEISDPQTKVKDALAEKYRLSTQELANLQIAIQSVSGSIGSMIDDHAISLSSVMPQASG